MIDDSVFAPFKLEGRRALVTGASSGLGRHFAQVLSRAGAEVIVGARRADRLADLVREIEARGGTARAVSLDVTDRASVQAALAAAGPVHVVVNNAGVGDPSRALDCSDEEWDKTVGTNLRGAWLVAQEGAKSMAAAGIAGSIINITSILASRVSTGLAAYSASKAGLAHLTRALALELAKTGIRFNSIAPGYFSTEINADFLASEAGDKQRARIPTKRFGQYDNLNGALLLLASDAGSHMTGAEIVVDGGHLISAL